MLRGYVKIHRELCEKGYYKDSHYVHLWLHLVLKANHAGNEFLWNEQNIMIQRGQLLTGEFVLASETGIERSKVRRILKCFENEHQIERQTTNKFSIITILNYDKYQKSEQQTEQPVNIKRTSSEQQVNTNNNNKNDKNDKNIYTNTVFMNFWDQYPKKVGKGAAWVSWKKLNPSGGLAEQILASVALHKKCAQWNRDGGQYIPNPATWLNQRRWEDEPSEEKKLSVKKY